MKYKKLVDFDALTEEEREALEVGEKTEDDLLKEWEQQEEEERQQAISLKAKELANNYKIRAEEAEQKAFAKLKTLKPEEDKETPKNLSYLDTIALIKADVSDEDISDVMDYASMKKISVAEALKSSVIKVLLAERKEERATAEVTSTGAKKPGTSVRSGQELLDDVEAGKFPQDAGEIDRLVNARLKSKARK
jgi:hypothetical protein